MKLATGNAIQIYQSRWWQLNSTICYFNSTAIVWDPAYDQFELDTIIKSVEGMAPADKFLIFTHGDYDHVAGDSSFYGFTKAGSSAMDAKSNKSDILLQIEAIDHEFYVKRNVPLTFPILDLKVTAQNPTIMTLGNLDVHFYRAGGHTDDGLFTLIPDLGLWVAGDYLSDIEFPFLGEKLTSYYDTLNLARQILKDYPIEMMVPGHGTPAFTIKDIIHRIDTSEHYLDSLMLENDITPWQLSWGHSPYIRLLDKMHDKNIHHVRSQKV